MALNIVTTIDQRIFQKGEQATQMLLDILNRKATIGSRLVLPVDLVLRDTA